MRFQSLTEPWLTVIEIVSLLHIIRGALQEGSLLMNTYIVAQLHAVVFDLLALSIDGDSEP